MNKSLLFIETVLTMKKVMMKFFYFITLLAIINCSSTLNENVIPEISYQDFLENVKTEKKDANDVPSYFFNIVHSHIPSYWVGTKWSFTGTTTKPQEGEIACGYFITNNLYNLGFAINRFKLAQEPSSYLIKQLCEKNSIKHFSDIDKMINSIKKNKSKDVFIVGLDFHTGFLTFDGEEVYFIHSNYINKEGVIKEIAKESPALNQSKSFMIGSLLQNTTLLDDWVKK